MSVPSFRQVIFCPYRVVVTGWVEFEGFTDSFTPTSLSTSFRPLLSPSLPTDPNDFLVFSQCSVKGLGAPFLGSFSVFTSRGRAQREGLPWYQQRPQF